MTRWLTLSNYEILKKTAAEKEIMNLIWFFPEKHSKSHSHEISWLLLFTIITLFLFFCLGPLLTDPSNPRSRLVLHIDCFDGSEQIDSVTLSLIRSASSEQLYQSVGEHCGFPSGDFVLKDQTGCKDTICSFDLFFFLLC